MTARRSRSAAVAIAIAVALAPALSGCFGNPIDGVVDRIGEEIENQGGDISFGEIPSDFPSEVPLVDGEVVTGFKVQGDAGPAWQVTLRVDSQTAADEGRTLLEDAGFTAPGESAGLDGFFESSDYTVIFTVTGDTEVLASYVVATK